MKKKKKMKWTQFMDMYSGGGTKEKPYEMIYIEAPKSEAKVIFYNKFGHNPERVSCICCGGDYLISESVSLEQASAYQRNCRYDVNAKCYVEEPGVKYGDGELVTIFEYLKRKDVLVIYAKDIKEFERVGEVPEEGYVWL
jgi:hypothetical protein